MADVRIELEEVKEDSESGRLAGAAPARPPKRAGARLWLFLPVLLLSAAGAGLWKMKSSNPARQTNLRQLTRDSGLTTDPALSGDGKLLAYASDRGGEENLDIWVQQLGGAEPLRLTRDATDERSPTFSPDGTRIAYRSEQDGGGIVTEIIMDLDWSCKRVVRAIGAQTVKRDFTRRNRSFRQPTGARVVSVALTLYISITYKHNMDFEPKRENSFTKLPRIS